MKKILFLFILLLGVSSLFSATVVKEIIGKVKVKYNGNTQWSRVLIGEQLPDNTLISTGFNSQMVLDLGNATIDVLPLTRLMLSEIIESQDTIKTSLFLQGGKIKADVGKIEGKVNDFKIKSPIATASVRGTAFEFTGNTLTVIRGEVAFTPTRTIVKKTATVSESEDYSEEGADTPQESADTSVGVAVRAGGQSLMVASGVKPISPATMAKVNCSVSAATKPAVIKNIVATMEGGDILIQDAPTPSAVLETISGIANVTITITIQ